MAAYYKGDPEALDHIRRLEFERDRLREEVERLTEPGLSPHSSGALLNELARRGWDVTSVSKLVIADVQPIRGRLLAVPEGAHRLGGEVEIWQSPGRVLR